MRGILQNEACILLEKHMQELGLQFVPEYRFHSTRQWRFDYLLPPVTAIEIEGAVWQQGRHQRPIGFQQDIEKYREATRLGYRVYRFSTDEVLTGVAREFLSNLNELRQK